MPGEFIEKNVIVDFVNGCLWLWWIIISFNYFSQFHLGELTVGHLMLFILQATLYPKIISVDIKMLERKTSFWKLWKRWNNLMPGKRQ